MYGFKEIALFLFSVLLSMIAAINLWKVDPERNRGKEKRVSIINMVFCLLILGIVFLMKKRLVITLVRLDVIFLFALLLPYMLRLRYVWRVIIAVMLIVINLIIAYHFPDIQDYIGVQLIVCGLFLSFVGRSRRIGNQSTL